MLVFSYYDNEVTEAGDFTKPRGSFGSQSGRFQGMMPASACSGEASWCTTSQRQERREGRHTTAQDGGARFSDQAAVLRPLKPLRTDSGSHKKSHLSPGHVLQQPRWVPWSRSPTPQ